MSLFARLVIAMVTLVLVTATSIALLTYHNLEQAILPRALERVETHTRLLAAELESYVRGARADVLGFRSAVALEGIVRARGAGGTDPLDGTTEATWRERMATRYVAELNSKPSYSQFRILGEAGQEIVRVERVTATGAVRIVPKEELQQKNDRSYFIKTMSLAPGEIYVSALDLNQERGVIETPHVPTLRIATPIHVGAKPFGIVIINVDMRPAFERLRSLTRPGGALYVVNERGDYLLHPDEDRAFGFEFGKAFRWQTDFPDIAASAGSAGDTTVVYRDAEGEKGAAGFVTARLAGATPVSVIQTVPNALIMAPGNAIQKSTLIAGSIAVLIAGLLAVLLARSLTLPLVQMTRAVEGFPNDAPVALQEDTSGEIGVLARAFTAMSRTMRDKTAALELEIAERRRIFDTTLDLILVVDSQGNFLQISPSCKTILGYAPDEMIGHSAIDFIFPADLDATRNEMRSTRRGRHTSNFECRYVHKIGHPVLLQWTGVWLEDVRRHYFIGRDMTDRRLAEEKFKLAVEASPSGMVMIDGSGAIVLVNAETERLFGYSRSELIGQSIDALVPSKLSAQHMQHRKSFLKNPATRRMGAGRDLYARRKDGSEFPVEIGLNPIETEQGPLILGVVVDISDRKRSEEAILFETEERKRLFEILSNTINSMVDAVLVADVTGKVVISNPAAEQLMGIVSGSNPQEWSRPNEVTAVDGSFVTLEQRPLMRAVRGETVDNFPMTARNKMKNKLSHLIANGGPIRDDSGQVRGAVVIYRDVTNARETERQLQHAQKMEAVGELTGGIAHDFNNILTVITGTIEILAEAVAEKPGLVAVAKMIDEAAGRGADLTQRLLAFARRQPLQPSVIDVNALVADAVKLLRPTLGEHIEIEARLSPDLKLALVDPSQLSSAIINLALNSRDAMASGGKLMIETMNAHLDEGYAQANREAQPGDYAMIAVSDSGEGIAAGIVDRVFEPFFTTKEIGRGSGLGLSMVYGFTKQSNGHIKIYSEVGHGTTIKLYLPQAAGEARVLPDMAAPPVESGSETILVVEDDALVRNYVVAQLNSLGYAVLTAANADEALKIIDSGKTVDLLFTDVIMPGSMNGRQLSDEALKRRPSLKVLFTSGYTENAIVHHGRLDPGVLLLAKPYRKADLARMIRQALASMAPADAPMTL